MPQTENNMRTYIQIPKTVSVALQARYGITERGLRKILNFLSNSVQANEIRSYAIANGGVLVRKEFYRPKGRLVHDERNNAMVYTCPNGVEVTISKKDGSAVIRRDGEVLEHYELGLGESWGNLLFMAEELDQDYDSRVNTASQS